MPWRVPTGKEEEDLRTAYFKYKESGVTAIWVNGHGFYSMKLLQRVFEPKEK